MYKAYQYQVHYLYYFLARLHKSGAASSNATSEIYVSHSAGSHLND